MIDLTPVNLSKQRIKSAGECFIELSPDYIRYRMQFVAEEPQNDDEAMAWEEKENDWDVFVQKKQVVSVEKWRCTNIERWKVIISVNGMAGDLTIYFRSQAKCEGLYKQLINYIFHADPDKSANQ